MTYTNFIPCLIFAMPPIFMALFYQWFDANGSGWKALSRLYRTSQTPTGLVYRRVSFAMNSRQYRGKAIIAMNSTGLYLSLLPALRFLHPPLLIPWRNIRQIETGSGVEFRADNFTPVRLCFKEPVLREASRRAHLSAPRAMPPQRRAG